MISNMIASQLSQPSRCWWVGTKKKEEEKTNKKIGNADCLIRNTPYIKLLHLGKKRALIQWVSAQHVRLRYMWNKPKENCEYFVFSLYFSDFANVWTLINGMYVYRLFGMWKIGWQEKDTKTHAHNSKVVNCREAHHISKTFSWLRKLNLVDRVENTNKFHQNICNGVDKRTHGQIEVCARVRE